MENNYRQLQSPPLLLIKMLLALSNLEAIGDEYHHLMTPCCTAISTELKFSPRGRLRGQKIHQAPHQGHEQQTTAGEDETLWWG